MNHKLYRFRIEQHFDLLPGVLPEGGQDASEDSLDYAAYDLSDTGLEEDNKPDRLVPMFSADSGLFFERELLVIDNLKFFSDR